MHTDQADYETNTTSLQNSSQMINIAGNYITMASDNNYTGDSYRDLNKFGSAMSIRRFQSVHTGKIQAQFYSNHELPQIEFEELPIKYADLFAFAAERIEIYDNFLEDLGEYQIETVGIQEKAYEMEVERNHLSDEIDQCLRHNGYSPLKGHYDENAKQKRLKDMRELLNSIKDKINSGINEFEINFKKEKDRLAKKISFFGNEVDRQTKELNSKDVEFNKLQTLYDQAQEELQEIEDKTDVMVVDYTKKKEEVQSKNSILESITSDNNLKIFNLEIENRELKEMYDNFVLKTSSTKRDYEIRINAIMQEHDAIQTSYRENQEEYTELEKKNNLMKTDLFQTKKALSSKETKNHILNEELIQAQESNILDRAELQEHIEKQTQQVTALRINEYSSTPKIHSQKLISGQSLGDSTQYNFVSDFQNCGSDDYMTRDNTKASLRNIMDNYEQNNEQNLSTLKKNSIFKNKLNSNEVFSSRNLNVLSNMSKKRIHVPTEDRDTQTNLAVNKEEFSCQTEKVKTYEAMTLCIDQRAKRLIAQEEEHISMIEWNKVLKDNPDGDLKMFGYDDANGEKSDAMAYQLSELKKKYNQICSYSKNIKNEYRFLEKAFEDKMVYHIDIINQQNNIVMSEKIKLEKAKSIISPDKRKRGFFGLGGNGKKKNQQSPKKIDRTGIYKPDIKKKIKTVLGMDSVSPDKYKMPATSDLVDKEMKDFYKNKNVRWSERNIVIKEVSDMNIDQYCFEKEDKAYRSVEELDSNDSPSQSPQKHKNRKNVVQDNEMTNEWLNGSKSDQESYKPEELELLQKAKKLEGGAAPFSNIIQNYKKMTGELQKNNEILKKNLIQTKQETNLVKNEYDYKILNNIIMVNQLTSNLCEVQRNLRAFWNLCKSEIDKFSEKLTPSMRKIANYMENMAMGPSSIQIYHRRKQVNMNNFILPQKLDLTKNNHNHKHLLNSDETRNRRINLSPPNNKNDKYDRAYEMMRRASKEYEEVNFRNGETIDSENSNQTISPIKVDNNHRDIPKGDEKEGQESDRDIDYIKMEKKKAIHARAITLKNKKRNSYIGRNSDSCM